MVQGLVRKFQCQSVPQPKVVLETYPSAPLDLEIGCGVGLHPTTYCKNHPDRNLIALDRSRLRMSKMKRTLKDLTLENIYPICEDADKFVVHQIQDHTIENLFLLYPNPYPKEKQGNKRWHRMPIMQCFLEKLTPQGKIHLATNMEFYAHEAKAFMTKEWGMKIEKENIYKDNLPFEPRTHFEKKYIERGETIYDLVFRLQD